MKNEEAEKLADESGIEIMNPESFEISWHKKLLMRFFPEIFFKMAAGECGLDKKKIDQACSLFEDAKIHIEPLSGGSRGFIITLDNKLSLWFTQDGKHFRFDGIEIGEYLDGEVTVVDNLNR